MVAHCLFEQSGTFKNEFKKLGVEAYDYDILNDYGQTDYVIDLFNEIRGGYNGEPSIFDHMTPDDIIFAFFPCTRFEAQITMIFRGESHQQEHHSDKQKLETDLKLHAELAEMYELVTKLALICIKRGLRLIIENPANEPHYLARYWAIKPKIKDNDRTQNGDWQKKPTQYWFIGLEPQNNLVWEIMDYTPKRKHEKLCNKVERSLIHPQYARRFIKQYILQEGKA